MQTHTHTHPVHLSHVHAFRRADRRYREVRVEGFRFKNCVRPLMRSKVSHSQSERESKSKAAPAPHCLVVNRTGL